MEARFFRWVTAFMISLVLREVVPDLNRYFAGIAIAILIAALFTFIAGINDIKKGDDDGGKNP
jgi:hypothetical protein